jgi:hypothetical protein
MQLDINKIREVGKKKEDEDMPKVRKMVVAGYIRWSAAFCNCSSSSLNFEHCWRVCRLFFRFLLEEDKKMK